MAEIETITKSAEATKSENAYLKEASIKQGITTYFEVVAQVERMHRLLLDVIKDEFTRLKVLEINPVQGLLLYNIGESEVSAGELRTRGYYQGSNVSYNLKKLVDLNYMIYTRNEMDKRSVRVGLSEKGESVYAVLQGLFTRLYSELITKDLWTLSDCRATRDNLMLMERYWSDQIRFIY